MATTFQHKSEQPSPQSPDLLDAEAQNSQAQGMAVVGQVAGGILHDFNNILTVITGTIDILAQAVVDRPELAAVAQLIDEAASRGVRLTSQLMAFARGNPPRPCEIDVDELLTDVARLLRPTLGTAIEVSVTVTPGTPTAFADSGQLMAALLCLAITARASLADGSKLSFEAAGHEAASAASPACVVITLTVARHAGGVAPARRVFTDFAMVDEFVGRSSGQLKISDPAGPGAIVEIFLPCGHGLLA